jgi:glycerol uptake facilitator-like aquaporin
MLATRWSGWAAALAVTLVAIALVALDVTDAGVRRWWAAHPFTTDTVAGLLVLLITLLVVDQVVARRQHRDRSRAVAAQAAIMSAQAARSARAVTTALAGSGDRSSASDEVRNYMIMLLVGAPVLIEARTSRAFLEEAQHLGGELARALTATSRQPAEAGRASDRVDAAARRVRSAAAPLLRQLNTDELTAAGDEPATP